VKRSIFADFSPFPRDVAYLCEIWQLIFATLFFRQFFGAKISADDAWRQALPLP
jgi:hypothetical protein